MVYQSYFDASERADRLNKIDYNIWLPEEIQDQSMIIGFGLGFWIMFLFTGL